MPAQMKRPNASSVRPHGILESRIRFTRRRFHASRNWMGRLGSSQVTTGTAGQSPQSPGLLRPRAFAAVEETTVDHHIRSVVFPLARTAEATKSANLSRAQTSAELRAQTSLCHETWRLEPARLSAKLRSARDLATTGIVYGQVLSRCWLE